MTATAFDFRTVMALLDEAGLPHADLTPTHLAHFRVLRDGDDLVGVVGLEVYGEAALLRSLAVAPGRRGEGLGGRLVDAAEAHARTLGVDTLYLLTTTAADFFAARGFAVTDRAAVPEAIAGTHEFAALCPASAVCMARRLTAAEAQRPAVSVSRGVTANRESMAG